MSEFKELRDRAYAFCKRLNFESADISIGDTSFVVHGNLKIFKVQFAGSSMIFTLHDRSRFIDVTESEWLAAIEQHYGQPFPSTIEAQGWVKTTERLPERDESMKYSQVPCLVYKRNEWTVKDKTHTSFSRQILQFNHEHQCWDQEDGDDHECDINQVEYWMPLPKIDFSSEK